MPLMHQRDIGCLFYVDMEEAQIPKPRKQTIGQQKKKINAMLKKFITARDGERCLFRGHPEVACGGPLHMSHIHSRGLCRWLEFEPDNLILLCKRHHLYWWHTDAYEAGPFARKRINRRQQARLAYKKNRKRKFKFNYEKLRAMILRKWERL